MYTSIRYTVTIRDGRTLAVITPEFGAEGELIALNEARRWGGYAIISEKRLPEKVSNHPIVRVLN